jgi:hypothetical protein
VPTPPGLPGFGQATGISVASRNLAVRGGYATARIVNRNVFDVPARLNLAGRAAAARTRPSMSTALIPRERTTAVRIRVSSSLAALIRRRGRASATVSIAVRDLNGVQRTVKRSVVLLKR